LIHQTNDSLLATLQPRTTSCTLATATLISSTLARIVNASLFRKHNPIDAAMLTVETKGACHATRNRHPSLTIPTEFYFPPAKNCKRPCTLNQTTLVTNDAFHTLHGLFYETTGSDAWRANKNHQLSAGLCVWRLCLRSPSSCARSHSTNPPMPSLVTICHPCL
jgi:hypothetical protein